MNKAASALGKKAKGVPKNLSTEEIARRTEQLAEARKKRWPKKKPRQGGRRGLGWVWKRRRQKRKRNDKMSH